ncbi:hypothetical protein D3C81_1739510 [compost metagenome]
MRQIGNGLNRLLVAEGTDLIEKQGEDNRQRESDEQLNQADAERVLDHIPQVLIIQKFSEVVKSYPRSLCYRLDDVIFLEGNDQPVHRNVVENNHPDHAKQRHCLQVTLGQQSPPQCVFRT